MSNDGNQMLLGRLAVHKKLITMEQLVEATREQGRFGNESHRLGEILIELGYLTPEQLQQLLVLQKAFLAELGQQAPATTPSPAAPAPAAPRAPAPTPSPWTPPEPAPAQAASASPPASSGLELDLERSGSRPPSPSPAPSAPAPTPSLGDEGGGDAVLTLDDEDTPALAAAAAGEPPSLVALSEPPGKAERLDGFLANAARRGASDVHVHPGAPAKVRIGGALLDVSSEPLDASFCEAVLREALNDAQRAILDERGQIDFSYSLEGIGRFRANLYRGLTGLNGVFRFVPGFVPSLVQLGLPNDLSKLTTFHQGLVLVTGPAGCGKSTTLASLVNIINEERSDHILTIEDPIEYLHPSKRCLVNQRQVSRHSSSFSRALRAALREDPDVIVIGELRDLETISLALTAAETGHLVLGTLHTSSAIRTVNRLVGAYPPDEQPQIRAMLSESLRAVISQRLLPRTDGQGRVPALEVLHVNKAVANTIRENKTFQLRSMMQTGRAQGMLLLDQSLQDLLRAGVVSKEEAARHVEDPRFLQ